MTRGGKKKTPQEDERERETSLELRAYARGEPSTETALTAAILKKFLFLICEGPQHVKRDLLRTQLIMMNIARNNPYVPLTQTNPTL